MNIFKFVIFTIFFIMLSGCSDDKSAADYIIKVKADVGFHKINESIIDLKNAIKIEPKNAEARFLLGQLYLRQGDGPSAKKELEKALQFKSKNKKLIPLLARAYILTQSDDEVFDLDPLTKGFPDDIKAHFLAYKTLAAVRTQNVPLAKESSKLARSLSENNIYAMLATAYFSLADNKLAKAKEFVARVLAGEEKNPDALLLQGQIYTALGEHEQATKNYILYSEVQPKSLSVILFIAESFLKEKKFNEAENYADAILDKVTNQPFAHYIKAVSRFENKDYLAASKHADIALSANFNQIQLKLIAGASAYFQQNFEQAHHHLGSILKFLPAEHPARKMYAVSLLQLGQVEGINEALENFTSSTKEDDKFLSTLSYQLAELGAYNDAKILVNKSSIDDPTNAEKRVREGIIKLMMNDPTGVQNLKDAIQLAPDLKAAELALAFASIQTQDYDQALSISKKWQKKYPNEPASYNILAAVYLKQGKTEQAKLAFDKSLAIEPKNIFAYNELISLALRQSNIKEAEKLSSKAIDLFPTNIRVLKTHYIIFKDNKTVKQATFNKIVAIYEADKTSVPHAMLYAELLIDDNKIKAAINVLESLDATINSPKKLWQLNIIAYRKLGDKDNQQKTVVRWHKTNPYHIEPILLMVDHYIKNQQLDKALTFVDDNLASNHENSFILQLVKMQVLLSSNKITEGKVLLHELKKQNIKTAVIDGFQGRIYLLEKKYAQAIPLLKAAYIDQPSSQNVLTLVNAYQANKQNKEAIAHLEQYLKNNQTDDRVRTVLADFYLKTSPKKAADSYAMMLDRQPNNVVILNNIAWLYSDSDNIDLALKYSKKAIELAPDYPNVVDTRGMVLLKAGKKIDAWKALLHAYELSKGKDNSITLNYAEVLIANKQKQEAVALIKRVRSKDSTIKKRKATLLALANRL